MTRRVIDHGGGRSRGYRAPGSRSSPRASKVLELIGRGLSNREIAESFVIEESTVKTHVKRILMKLGLRDRVQAVILAYRTGLIGLGRKPAQATPRLALAGGEVETRGCRRRRSRD